MDSGGASHTDQQLREGFPTSSAQLQAVTLWVLSSVCSSPFSTHLSQVCGFRARWYLEALTTSMLVTGCVWDRS